MTDKSTLSDFYHQDLETNIIAYLAEKLQIDYRDAMKLYYDSRLSKQIEAGENGIDNLDYKNLAEDLIENEIGKKTDERLNFRTFLSL